MASVSRAGRLLLLLVVFMFGWGYFLHTFGDRTDGNW